MYASAKQLFEVSADNKGRGISNMPHIPHWIEAQISTHFEGLDLNAGVDFDGSGAVEGSERTDTNNDGTVDANEWRTFLNANEFTLRNFGGFFNYYFDYGTAFKADNPLHDILFIESVIADETQIASSYQIVQSVVDEFRPVSTEGGCPLANIHNIYAAMHRVGIEFEEQENALFVENILRRHLDCDTSSNLAMVVAHEMGWTVHMVLAPQHVFIRYDDGTYRFNMDYGYMNEDDYYISHYNISSQSLSEHVYLADLSYEETLGFFYGRIGIYYLFREMFEEAIPYLDQALKLYPNFAQALLNRGSTRFNLNDYKGALRDSNRLLGLDPNSACAYNNRGVLRRDVGDIAGAVRDLERAVALEPDNTKYSLTLLEVRMLYWNSQDMGGGPF